eukprot:354266-Chlamydomonas_euryale.AAC.6
MLYLLDVASALLYALLEISCLTDQQLQPLVSVHNTPAPGHRHGQKARWHPLPDPLDVRGDGGAPAHTRPQCCEASTPRTRGRMPDGSVVKQLLFAEGLVGVGGVVVRPRSTRRDKVVAALSPGWQGVGVVLGGSGPRAIAGRL